MEREGKGDVPCIQNGTSESRQTSIVLRVNISEVVGLGPENMRTDWARSCGHDQGFVSRTCPCLFLQPSILESEEK